MATNLGSEAVSMFPKESLLAWRDSDPKHREKMTALIAKLGEEAKKRVNDRKPVEAQWVEDLLQYHARYDAAFSAQFALGQPMYGRANVNMPKTREKTNGMIASLMHTLFPVDDKNWEIAPTPVPEIDGEAEKIAARLEKLRPPPPPMLPDGTAAPQEPAPVSPEMDALEQAHAEKQALIDEAKARAQAMAKEIDDQLEECRWQAQCRDVIESACKIGTGLMLGPLANDKVRRGWKKVTKKSKDEETGEESDVSAFELGDAGTGRPAAWALDPWNAFPSSDWRTPEDSEGLYIRHLWTKRQMRAFAKFEGVDVDAVQSVLAYDPSDPAPDYIANLRSVGSQTATVGMGHFYVVWQYIGPLTAEDKGLMALHAGDLETATEMGEVGPLEETQAIVWFCNGTLLKFGLHPLDSGAPLFRAFNFEKEEGTGWGYGIPRIMRSDAHILNSIWRMVIDNADLSAGGLLVIDKAKVRPVDGTPRLYGRKIYEPQPGVSLQDARTAIAHVDIPSRQGELLAIIELCRRQIDEETSQPSLGGDSEKVPAATNTAMGTALWLNNFNILKMRVIKNWDDDLVEPMISDFYDWNMQFSDNDEIKGDMKVKARGSSVLLVREMQAMNIMTLAMSLGGHPVYGPWIKPGDNVREMYRASSLDPDLLVRSDAEAQEEIAAMQQAAAAQAGGTGADPEIEMRKLDIEEARIEADIANGEADRAMKEHIAELEYDSRMAMAAAQMQQNQDKLEADMASKREKLVADQANKRAEIAQKERSIAAEAALRAQPEAPENQTQIANS